MGKKVYIIETTPQGSKIIGEATRSSPGTEGGMVRLQTIPHQLYARKSIEPKGYEPPKSKTVFREPDEVWTTRESARSNLISQSMQTIERALNDIRRYVFE
jgi:hypothetical protein